ncbi:GNAT family N-acetyltransferase [Streptomyces sp. NPDC088354]|uniref:GNAT family N-acetyltransferase n=1 Tax=unclassified Streptomyces TaxID=2593676 RepID=UPI0029A19566|nr:GNAT family N-acetyltransferase [Streptomyces sp. MI02-7b]MDX3075569.1 GNAT family N-acetyltransferase [Streptomyces sp. MI02-7b]
MPYTVREYTPADETSWLRCRVVSFLGTAYFDNVQPSKSPSPVPGLDLIVVDGDGSVVGIMDTTVEGESATINTVAIHPDHRRRGLAGRLLEPTRDRARRAGASTLDAWTRDDEDTLRWYRAMGFAESDHYLHVYASHSADTGEPDRAIGGRRPGLLPMASFSHARLADAVDMRDDFTRVHVCRRFSMPL